MCLAGKTCAMHIADAVLLSPLHLAVRLCLRTPGLDPDCCAMRQLTCGTVCAATSIRSHRARGCTSTCAIASWSCQTMPLSASCRSSARSRSVDQTPVPRCSARLSAWLAGPRDAHSRCALAWPTPAAGCSLARVGGMACRRANAWVALTASHDSINHAMQPTCARHL